MLTLNPAEKGALRKPRIFFSTSSPAICVDLGVLLAYEMQCSQGRPYWRCSAVVFLVFWFWVVLVLCVLFSCLGRNLYSNSFLT